MADLTQQKQITAELKKQQTILEAHNKTSKAYKQAAAEINKLGIERFKIEQKISNEKNRASQESTTLNIEKQILKLQKTGLGALQKHLGLDKQIKLLKDGQSKNDKETVRQTKAYGDLLQDVASGSKDLEAVLNTIATEDFGMMNKAAVQLADTLRNTPGLSEKLKLDAQAQQKIDDFRDKIKETSALLSSPKAMGVAAIGMAVKLITDFAGKALEVKQSLGTAAGESLRVAGNMTAAGAAAKMLGGNAQQAEAAVTAMVDEFGTLNVLSLETSLSLGAMVSDTGLTGANAAKLLKSMESISTASIETNMNLISSTAELARAEGVAPAQVLNDIAESTETFALFAKDGGENIAKAAIEARKLGLNLATVAGIADNLLDFESSIGKEMEASMLLGRQMSLDKARELALTGDLAGLAEEVKSQVGSQAEFEAMNVVQRKALAAAIGVTASDLGKMVAGEKTSAEMAEEKNKQQMKFIGLQKLAANAQIISAVAGLYAGNAKFGPLGFALATAGIMSMYAAISSAPKLEKGGVVKETGMAVVHKGEAFSGTRNEMGMGSGQTNVLLKQLIKQNDVLMNRLTNKIGDIALSNAV